ncbi:hypothetical protein Tcan_01536, partial [Toxocara canis]
SQFKSAVSGWNPLRVGRSVHSSHGRRLFLHAAGDGTVRRGPADCPRAGGPTECSGATIVVENLRLPWILTSLSASSINRRHDPHAPIIVLEFSLSHPGSELNSTSTRSLSRRLTAIRPHGNRFTSNPLIQSF